VTPESTWTTVLPVAFIIISLLSLVILPLAVARHTSNMRREISGEAEPARQAANELQLQLSTELDDVFGFQVTTQSQFAREYASLVRKEAADLDRLRKLAPQLHGDVAQALATAQSAANDWHRSVRQQELTTRPMPSEVFNARLFESHPKYEKAVVAAADLAKAIQLAIDDRLRGIRDAERLGVSLTLVLTLLALTSAILVAGLGRQMRLLAKEATRRRLEAEREATEARGARESAEREERRSAFLAAAGQEFSASLDFEATVTTLARMLVPNLAEMCLIDIAEDGTLRRAAVAHRDPAVEARILAASSDPQRPMPDAVARVLQARDTRVVGNSEEILAAMVGDIDVGSGSLLILPLVSRARPIGVITASAKPGSTFAPDDAALATELARRASLAIDNALLYAESQQAVRAREEVLAIVSHDLRNPLNAITLSASMMQMGEQLDDEQREQLQIVLLSAKRMSRLIADLLDVTRLEGGKRLPIDPAELDVESLFREAYEIFRSQATSVGVDLRYEVGAGVPSIWADRHRVMQVVSNLIGNALKFTPSGGFIAYDATLRGDDVLMRVRDSGPGIPPEHLGDIFNPYWQAKRAERLGAGLGLPIAKGIVESHGGRIWAESEPGQGTTFFFTIPRLRES
jgi:signal transduction histidine kinase/CHASE3 domain sensor protein